MSLRDLLDAAYAALIDERVSAGRSIGDAAGAVDGWLADMEARSAAEEGDRSLLQQQNSDAMQQLMAMVARAQPGGAPA